jgi:hypothetical protein
VRDRYFENFAVGDRFVSGGKALCLLTRLVFQRQTGIGLVSGQGGNFTQPERRP